MARDIRILVIGKASLMRDALWALLRGQVGMEALEPLDSETSLIKSAGADPIPDLVIMYSLVVTPAVLDVIALARRRWPSAHALVLTLGLDDRAIAAAMEVGAEACISVSDSHRELFSAIRNVCRGERYRRPSTASESVSGPDELTDREKVVMRLIAAGYRTREIADRLSLSRRTIDKCRTGLMRKLGLKSSAAVVAYAITHGHAG